MNVRSYRWLTALLALLLTAAPAGAEDPVTRAYDLGLLIRPIADRPGPALGFANGAGSGGVESADPDDPRDVAQTLVELIRNNVQWSAESRIRMQGSALIIHALPAAQAQVAALLDGLRASHARPLRLKIAVYRGPASAVGAILKGGPVLDEAARKALAAAPWRVVHATQLTAFSGQRVHLQQSRLRRYLRDYDVEVATESTTADPYFETLRLGRVDDVRPMLSSDGTSLLVECRLTRVDAPQPFAPFATGVPLLGLQSEDKSLLAPLQQPTLTTRAVRTSVWLPTGGASLAALRADDEDVLLTVVAHLDRAAAPAPAPGASGRRTVRTFDLRYLTYQPSDFKGPELGRMGPSSGPTTVGGAVFSGDAEAGVRLTPDGLVQLIKTSVDEDSWHNTRNKVQVVGRNQLIVTQTPQTQAKLAALLTRLEQARQVSTLLRARILTPADAQRSWLADRAGRSLSAEDRKALAAMTAAGSVPVTDDMALIGLLRQTAHVRTVVAGLYVADYEVEVAEKATMLDPEVAQYTVGSLLQAQVMLAGKDQLLVELRRDQAELRELKVVELARKIKAQAPAIDRVVGQASMLIPNGGAYLLALSPERYALVEVTLGRPAK